MDFSLAFSRTEKSMKMVGVPGKSWKSVNSSNKVFLQDIEEQPGLEKSWKFVSEKGYKTCMPFGG